MEDNVNNEDLMLEEGIVQAEEPMKEVQEVEDVSTPQEEKKEKERKELTPAEIQRRKKMLVYPLIFLVFTGAMWLIFAPSSDDKENQMQKGFNIDVPLPNEKGLMDDKRKAYEQDAFEKQRKTKMGTLQDFEITIGQEESSPISVLTNNMVEEDAPHTSNSSVRSSAVAYQDMNRQLGTFYQEPKKEEDDQKQLELEWRIQELERMQEEAQQRKTTADEQLELMEKSYQLAAKYIPGGKNGEQETQSAINFGNGNTGNTQVIAAPVREVKEQVVSILAQPMSDADFVNVYSKPRNLGFNTVQTAEESISKNTIKASVYRTVTLTDGKDVQLRLLEPMMVGNSIYHQVR